MTRLPPDLSIPELSPLRYTFDRAIGDGWKPKVACYIAWCAHPKEVRDKAGLPETKTDLAIALGSKAKDPGNLFRNWSRRYDNLDAYIFTATREGPLNHYRPEVIKAMIDTAKTTGRAGHADRKMYLEMTGDYSNKQVIEFTDKEIDEMSKDELEKYLDK